MRRIVFAAETSSVSAASIWLDLVRMRAFPVTRNEPEGQTMKTISIVKMQSIKTTSIAHYCIVIV
jgi:hypothetical protein